MLNNSYGYLNTRSYVIYKITLPFTKIMIANELFPHKYHSIIKKYYFRNAQCFKMQKKKKKNVRLTLLMKR